MQRSFFVLAAALAAGCGASPTTAPQLEALTVSPPGDCYRTSAIPFAMWFAGEYRNFVWPGDPWREKKVAHGWVVVTNNDNGTRSIYGITKGPADSDNQVVWFDRAASDDEIDALRCLPENQHCPGLAGLSCDMGQVRAGDPPAAPSDPHIVGIAICVPKAIFTEVDTACASGVGARVSCGPACVPKTCRASMHGSFDDGCGGQLCCNLKPGQHCE